MIRTFNVVPTARRACLAAIISVFLPCVAMANLVATTVEVTPRKAGSSPKVVAFNESPDGDGLHWTAPDDTKTLKVTLTSGREFKCDNETILSETIAWTCPTFATWATSHIYTTELITPKDAFRPLFTGPFRPVAGGGGGATPTWYSGVIQADIQADADNDSTTAQRPPSSTATERKEEEVAEHGETGNTTGLIIPVNTSYHEGGTGAVGNMDHAKTGIVTDDPDLVQGRLRLNMPTEAISGSTVKLIYDDSKLLVYKLSEGSGELVENGKSYQVTDFGTDNTLLFEGLAASANTGGDNIRVILTPKSGDVSRDKLVATVVSIDVDIYSGGYNGGTINPRKLTPETNTLAGSKLEDEESVGAFTVANMNDTDGDGTTDSGQRNITAKATGNAEQDLMLLKLHQPEPTDLPGNVRIRVASGSAKIWQDAEKTGSEVTGAGLTKAVSDGTFWSASDDHDWFVEITAPTALQGVKLKYEYQPAAAKPWMAAPVDTVAATAIWATATRVLTANKTPAQVDSYLGADYVANGGGAKTACDGSGGTGVKTYNNGIVIEFTLQPSNIATAAVPVALRPHFDVTRQRHGMLFKWNLVSSQPTLLVPVGHPAITWYPDLTEQPNDDIGEGDETAEPTSTGHMWVFDGPGGGAGVLVVHRNNFREFLRVRFDGNPTGEVSNGSRCSPKQQWYSKTTYGEATAPNVIATGNFTFAKEALSTRALVTNTTPGTVHNGYNKGLSLAATAGAGGETISVRMIDDESYEDLLHTTPAQAVFGKLASTKVGDQVAYTVKGDFASSLDGTIVGPDGSSGEGTAELAHQFVASGAKSTYGSVTGTDVNQPAPSVPTMVLGAITTVSINNAYVDATANGGGNQTVAVRIVDADVSSDDTLYSASKSVPRVMAQEGGGTTGAIKDAAFKFSTTGTIAAKADGTVIGPAGSGGETSAEIAYEVGASGDNSPEQPVSGPVYTMTAPVIGTNPIPVAGTSTVTINNIYIEATGSTGNETFAVRVIDVDTLLDPDDLLHNVTGVTIARPAGCFTGALIGPTSTVGTLTDPAPGGEVKGPSGASGEATAEVGYEIGPSSDNSPYVSVTGL